MRLDLRNCDCMDLMADLPAKSQHLVVVDPPYFEVKGDFDFAWDCFDDYLHDVKKWASEIKRVLADNGTVLWWGHAKKIAYTQIILDEFFTLENSLVWRKTDAQSQKQEFATARCFAPVTERLLMYSNGTEPEEWDRTGWESVKLDAGNFKPLREYFKGLQAALDLTKSEILEVVGQKADHCFRWGSTQWGLPTEPTYLEICKLPLKISFQRKEYEELRKEYEELRRPFSNTMKLEDVLEFSQEAHLTGRWGHPTQKPPTLCRALIQTCSRRGQNLLIPFAGSFVEVVEGANLGLNVTASEMDPKYFKRGMERVQEQTAQIGMGL